MKEFLGKWIYFKNPINGINYVTYGKFTNEIDEDGVLITDKYVDYNGVEHYNESGIVDFNEFVMDIPITWTSPEGVKYPNFVLLSETVSDMNDINWYQVMEETNDNGLLDNAYTERILSELMFDEPNKIFKATFERVYKSLEEVRSTKLETLNADRDIYVESVFDNIPDNEKWVMMYRVVGLLITSLNQPIPREFVLSNTYLQEKLLEIVNINTAISVFNNKISQVEIETDIETIVNL